MRHIILIVTMGLMMVTNPCSGQDANKSVTKTVLVSLATGEQIQTGESCLSATFKGDVPYIVTSSNNGFFVYEGKQRKGPFASFDKVPVKPCDENDSRECSVYKPDQEAGQPQYLQSGDDGMFRIQFGGRTYGPYALIAGFRVSTDNTFFVALTMDMRGKSTLVTSDGVNMVLDGSPVGLQVSPDGKRFIIAVKQEQQFDPSMLNKDFSKMTVEEITKFSQEMEEKQKNAPPLQSFIYTNNGKKLGPYDLNAFYSDNPCFTTTGSNNWIMVLDNTLFVNGALVKKYDDLYFSTCEVWLSKDGKSYAISTYDKILFSDGQEFPYPLVVNAVEKDGKSILQWISLENEKDIVQYSREL